MKYISILIISLNILSCIATKKQIRIKDIEGKYYYEFKDGTNYSLILNKDSTFSYITKGGRLHSGSTCHGKWTQSNGVLSLKCFEEQYPAQISSGYMNEREKQAIIVNETKLKLDNVVLKKQH